MTAVISNHIRTYQRPYVHARTTANYDHNNCWTLLLHRKSNFHW